MAEAANIYYERAFDPALHTIESLGGQLEALSESGIFIAGSLGRAAFYGGLGLGYNLEYNKRGQEITRKENPPITLARDIDIVTSSISQGNAAEAPFPIDRSAFCGRWVRMVLENSDWWLVSDKHNFQERIDPSMMEPTIGKIGEHEIITLPWATQYALSDIHGNTRPEKVTIARDLLLSVATKQDQEMYREKAGPFFALGQMNEYDPMMRLRSDIVDKCRSSPEKCLHRYRRWFQG